MHLATVTRKVAASALSLNTQRNYGSVQKGFIRFCICFGVEALPISDEGLAQYCVFQSQTCTPASLRTYFSAIRTLHLDNGYEWSPVRERHFTYMVFIAFNYSN